MEGLLNGFTGIVDSGAATAIDINNRTLNNTSGFVSVDWSATGYNASAAISFDNIGDAFIAGVIVDSSIMQVYILLIA